MAGLVPVQESAVLNERNQLAYDALGIEKKDAKSREADLRQWMCDQYYDVRDRKSTRLNSSH